MRASLLTRAEYRDPETDHARLIAEHLCAHFCTFGFSVCLIVLCAAMLLQPASAANTPPVVSIRSPAEGSVLEAGQDITFAATVTDLEEKIEDSSIIWTSDIDRRLGSGRTFTRTVSPGLHLVTARAKDSKGASADDSVIIVVQEKPGPAATEPAPGTPDPAPPPAPKPPPPEEPPEPFDPIRGACYPVWWHDQYASPESDSALARLAGIGATHVALAATWYQATPSSTSMGPDSTKTPSDKSLVHAIQRIRALKMEPEIRLLLVVSGGGWRGDVSFHSEDDWGTWFANYEGFLGHYARLAEEHGIRLLCIGTELKGTVLRRADWSRLIAGVRKVFSGKLTYAANFDCYQYITFWGDLDYIGINAYFPLTGKRDATLQELKDGWEAHRAAVAGFFDSWNKPVIFTEIGYRSVDGTNMRPWECTKGMPDEQEQADCYRAALESFWGERWFAGMYLWCWYHTRDFEGYGIDGKPAMAVIRKRYARPGQAGAVEPPAGRPAGQSPAPAPAPARAPSEPTRFMPLAPGNSWTYGWTSQVAERGKDSPARMKCFLWYAYGKKAMSARGYIPIPPDHEETYAITRAEGDHHFYTVSSRPDVSGNERDGRYGDSVENCWTLWRSDNETGVTESVKREWDYPSRSYLLDDPDAPNPAGYPSDDRNVIHIKPRTVSFALEYVTGSGNRSFVQDFDMSGVTVTVPAGTFRGCIETTCRISAAGREGEKPVLEWETHTLFAPGVGMVREYQRLPDSTVVYDIRLITYTTAKGTAAAGGNGPTERRRVRADAPAE